MVGKVITTLLEQETQHHVKCRESCGMVLVAAMDLLIKCKVGSLNLVPYLAKLMLTSRLKSIETSKSETTFRSRRKRI